MDPQAQATAEVLVAVPTRRSRAQLRKKLRTGHQSWETCRQRALTIVEAPRPSTLSRTRQGLSRQSNYGTDSALCSRTCSGGG
jgi:hypothetical protein